MMKLRFVLALWASKLAMLYYHLRGQDMNDMPGLLAVKLCPEFLRLIRKPPLVIAITGTNGKTTTSAIVNNMLRERGLRTSFNSWGANLSAGYAVNLLRGVNLFNRCTKVDASVLEADELTLRDTMSRIRPGYVIVSNVFKDSLRRNAHPENIFNRIQAALETLSPDTVLVLNANDPISSRLGTPEQKKIFYAMDDLVPDPAENMVRDIAVCPLCGEDIAYDYRLYRSLGRYHCVSCSFGMPEPAYRAVRFAPEDGVLTVRESDGAETEYPLISDTLFNAFNVLSAVTLFREMGIEPDFIRDFLSRQKVTDIRETCVRYNGIDYYAYAAKAQNVSAASTVFDYMRREPSAKDVVLLLDEVQDRHHATETLTWLYETDYEFLAAPNIRRVIVGGHMYLNHKLRLLLAGVPEDRIFAVEDEADIPALVQTEGIEKVYVLYEIDYTSKAKRMRDAIVEKAKEVRS